MVIAFDLDDTLYPEISFVRSGFRAVARFLSRELGLEPEDVEIELNDILAQHGRGLVFDYFLASKGYLTKSFVRACVTVYRQHVPDIELFSSADSILRELHKAHSLYLVTDGNKEVQKRKIDALGLWGRFDSVFITHRFGLSSAKPSIYCFEKIRMLSDCDWSEMVYVGDNPNKDFVGLKPLGVRTVRVLYGQHRLSVVEKDKEADYLIEKIEDFGELLSKWPH